MKPTSMDHLTPHDAEAPTAPSQVGMRLDAVILLGGGLSASPLGGATGCSVLDLLVTPAETVLDRWMRRLERLNGMAAEDLRVIVAAGGSVPAPERGTRHSRSQCEVVTHDREYRGAAGVLHDVTQHLSDDALLLVGEAARCPDFDVRDVVAAHLTEGNAVTVAVNPDGSPAGVYLLTRSLLGLVQAEGYMDLKEQWLGKVIATGQRVGVHRIRDGSSRPLRTPEQLLSAARAAALDCPSHSAEHFASVPGVISHGTFQCVSADARVAPDAVIIDSIIMPGARVGAGCVVARSIVCTDATLAAGEVLVDSVRATHAPGRNGHHKNGKHAGGRP